MATLTVTDLSLTGATPTLTAAAGGGDVFANDGRVFFMVTNASTASKTLTFTAQQTTARAPGFGDVTVSNTTLAVPAATTKIIGPFPTSRFNNSSGQVAVTYSAVTSTTVNPFRLTPAS
jgi:hypothetical protein